MGRGNAHGRISDAAVTEIISTLILISLAVVMFSGLSVLVLNPFLSLAQSVEPSTATLVSYIDKSTADTIVLEHRGGDVLKHYRITYIISTYTDPPTVFNETKTEADSGPSPWTVGERFVYTSPISLANKKVEVVVVDKTTNTVLIDKNVQDSAAFSTPYTIVYDPNNVSGGVTETTAQMRMYYNFIKFEYYYKPSPGRVYFAYQEIDAIGNPVTALSTTASVIPLPLDGYYMVSLSGLTPDHRYQFQATIVYGSSAYTSPFMQFWTYSNARGLWHLNEGLSGGGFTAMDAARPPVNGVVNGATFIADVPHSNGYISFSSESQEVDISNHHKFDLPNTITVREWINSLPGGSSFFGKLDELDNTSLANISAEWIEPRIINIYHDIFAVVYRTLSAPGSTITTFRAPSNGTFAVPLEVIDTESFSVGNYEYDPDILYIGNDIYAISYGSRYFDIDPGGLIITVNIASDGTITPGIIDMYQTTSFYGKCSRIFWVSGTVYGVAFGGDYSQAYLMQTGGIITISIDAQGHFSPLLYTKKFSELYCSKADVVRVNGNIFAVAYDDDVNGTACVMTVSIDGNGVVSVLGKIHASLRKNMEPSIVLGDQTNLYVVAYGGDSDHPQQGVVQKIVIATNGTVSNFSGSISFPSSVSVCPQIALVSSNIYLISYSEGYPSVKCRVFTIRITDHIEYRDDLVFSGTFSTPLQGMASSLVPLTGVVNRFLVGFGTGNTSAGFIGTVTIDLSALPQTVIKKGTMFQVEIVDQTVTVTVKTSDGYHSSSGTLLGANTWNHVVFTYSSLTLQLYVNCVASAPVSCTGSLEVNTDPIVFGKGFIGYLDEVGIYAQAFDSGGVSSDYTATNHYS